MGSKNRRTMKKPEGPWGPKEEEKAGRSSSGRLTAGLSNLAVRSHIFCSMCCFEFISMQLFNVGDGFTMTMRRESMQFS
jgi:hypothetical protein